MGLLSGGGAAVMNSVFYPLYLEGMIYARETVYDSGGDSTVVETSFECRLQVDDMSEAMRAQQGASDSDRRIMILTKSTEAQVNTDCEVDVLGGAYAGQRYQVASVGSDPLFSHWVLRGKRAGS